MHQIRQRTQANTRPYFTCGGLSSEEMTVKIVKSSKDSFWYKDLIGRHFDALPPLPHHVRDDWNPEEWYYNHALNKMILRKDCEIISNN
jgi:hypothetical protein